MLFHTSIIHFITKLKTRLNNGENKTFIFIEKLLIYLKNLKIMSFYALI